VDPEVPAKASPNRPTEKDFEDAARTVVELVEGRLERPLELDQLAETFAVLVRGIEDEDVAEALDSPLEDTRSVASLGDEWASTVVDPEAGHCVLAIIPGRDEFLEEGDETGG